MINRIQKSLNAWQKNSLKFRLLVSALVMVVVMLPIIGITLTNAFEKQLSTAMKSELSAYSYSILAVAEVENKQLLMPEALLETQFNVSQSGLYALISSHISSNLTSHIKPKTKTLWASQSFLTLPLPKNLPRPDIGKFIFSELVLAQQPHLVYSFTANFRENNQNFTITLHIIKNQAQYIAVLSEFKQQLWSWLAVLMLAFIGVQVFWLLWTLKPLTALTQELAKVEQGKQNALTQEYPLELQQVTSQLNTLLQTEQNQRKRYRNALADLAHSLKNPLAILQTELKIEQKGEGNEKRLSQSSQQLRVINQMIEHQLKRAQSAGESAWHLGISVKDVVEKLTNTLVKIHRDKVLHFQIMIEDDAIFKGDEADLMEMLGNILDNACKAAKHTISVSAKYISAEKNSSKELNGQTLVITLSDDGNGIEASQRETILQRGLRADTYQQGHGIGLAIVRDLVASYHGELHIGDSKELGGAEFTLLFSYG